MTPQRIKPDHEEMEERIEFVQQLMAKDLRKSDIKRAFWEQFGPTNHSTVEDYMGRARARNIKALERPKNDWVAESVEFYRDIATDPTSEPRDKIKARERIDKLLGLDAPVRTEHSGVDGGPIQIEQLIAASELTHLDVQRALSECRITETTTN